MVNNLMATKPEDGCTPGNNRACSLDCRFYRLWREQTCTLELFFAYASQSLAMFLCRCSYMLGRWEFQGTTCTIDAAGACGPYASLAPDHVQPCAQKRWFTFLRVWMAGE